MLWVDPADHVWAAGANDQVLEWNGAEWVPHPTTQKAGWVQINGTSARDIWLRGLDSSLREHLAHFDGSAWQEIEAPISRIDGIQAATPRELWIVGDGSLRKEVWRYSGNGWASIVLPKGLAFASYVQLSGRGRTDVWALESAWVKDRYAYSLHHFDGDGWSTVPLDVGGNLLPLSSGQVLLGAGKQIVIVNPFP